MSSRATKSVALGVGSTVLATGIIHLTSGVSNSGLTPTGETITGIVLLLAGYGIIAGYQLLEEDDHKQAYNDFFERVGADTIEALAEYSADEIHDSIGKGKKGKLDLSKFRATDTPDDVGEN